MAQRIKGMDAEIMLVADGRQQDSISTIKNFDFVFELETSSEGYLGETTERKDSIFKGISGKFDLHMDNQQALLLAAQIVDKARRRVAGFVVNIKVTLNFPNGERPRVVIPNVELGQIPFSFPDRAQYLQTTINYVASDANVIPSR